LRSYQGRSRERTSISGGLPNRPGQGAISLNGGAISYDRGKINRCYKKRFSVNGDPGKGIPNVAAKGGDPAGEWVRKQKAEEVLSLKVKVYHNPAALKPWTPLGLSKRGEVVSGGKRKVGRPRAAVLQNTQASEQLRKKLKDQRKRKEKSVSLEGRASFSNTKWSEWETLHAALR